MVNDCTAWREDCSTRSRTDRVVKSVSGWRAQRNLYDSHTHIVNVSKVRNTISHKQIIEISQPIGYVNSIIE